MLKSNKSLNYPLNRLSGFTLIEALISITVLLVAILALMNIFPLALKINHDSSQNTMAANLAQAKIEEMVYFDYDNIEMTGESKNRLSTDPESPFYYFQRQVEVEYVDENLNSSITDQGLKKITVTVFWHSPVSISEKSETFSLILSQK